MYKSLPTQEYTRMPKRMPRSLGFERHALRFDGVDDYVEVPDSESLNITDAITIEAWIKTSSSYARIVAKEENTSANHYYAGVVSGKLEGSVRGTGGRVYSVRDGISISDNIWHHVAITFVLSGNMTRYVDGSQTGTITDISSVGNISNDFNLYIGSRGSGDYYFHGSIALVRIYNIALSAEKIRWNMLNYHNPVRDGLVLWLPMEEGSGLTVYDKSGYGNNGSLLPADDPPTWQRVRQYELRAEAGV